MGKESMTLRDLFASIISGDTMAVGTTTDIVRSIIGESSDGNYLKISGGSGGGGTGPAGPEGPQGPQGIEGPEGPAGADGTGGGVNLMYDIENITTADITGVTFKYYRVDGVDFNLPYTTEEEDGSWIKIKNIGVTPITINPINGDMIDFADFKILELFFSLSVKIKV